MLALTFTDTRGLIAGSCEAAEEFVGDVLYALDDVTVSVLTEGATDVVVLRMHRRKKAPLTESVASRAVKEFGGTPEGVPEV
jgi:hypothetical protein